MKQEEFDRMYQNCYFAKQITAEVVSGFANGLGLVMAAALRQIDPKIFARDLRAQIAGAKMVRSIPPMAIDVATHALAAADAEIALRDAPEGPSR